MNGLVIVLIGIVALSAGYLLYGRWLAKKWGIDPKAKTPAYTHEDGQDYVPSSKFTVFSHQFSSIAGAGPVTGPILASVFGWVPVLLWLIIGGLFFGAVQDFGALYASVKNEGKSMGMIIEKYIGKTGRKLFMLFCWLFTLLVIAAFTDMVAGTFNGVGLDSAETAYANSAAASISMLFIVVAVIFGVIQKHVGKMNEWVKAVVAIALLVAMFAVGMKLPIYTSKTAWIYIIMAYLFLASVLPMWLLMQPRDYMTTFMLLGMIIGAVVVFVYTVVGGYLSVVMTDFIQGMLMFFALAVVFIGTVASAGGVDNTVEFLRAIPGYLSGTQVAAPKLDPATGQQLVEAGKAVFGAPSDYGIITIISMLAWGLGYFGMPQVLVRFLSIRSVEEVRKSRIISTSWCVISLGCAVCIGLVGRAMMPTELLTSTDAETIFIVLAQTLLPSFMCGVVVSGIFAASMSSSSSYLIIGASAMGENIFRGLLHRKATDKQVMIVARVTLVVMFLFGILVAYDQNSSIFQVVSYAWAGLGASFGPLMLCSLYWRRANKAGAVAGMLSGTAAVLIWHNLVKPLGGVFAIYELLPAFIISLLFIVVVSLLTAKPNKRMLYEFDHYMDDPLPGTLPSGTVLVDEPMEAMESEVRSGK